MHLRGKPRTVEDKGRKMKMTMFLTGAIKKNVGNLKKPLLKYKNDNSSVLRADMTKSSNSVN
jgi:hypothetical protein